MERCHSVLSLPQDSRNTAKYNLVKIARSDGETSMIFEANASVLGDHDFKSKKRKTKFLNPMNKLSCKGDGFVAPSVEISSNQEVARVLSQDDLWKSIQTNYSFLMADDLITECQETRKELHLHPPSSDCENNHDSTSPHHMLSFPEFLDKFNHIHDSLHTIQTSLSHTELSETDYEKFHSECQYLKEQAALLKLMNPDLKDDINRRCNILSNKLNILERLMFPKREQEKNEIIQGLAIQMKGIRKWLQEVESKLRKLKLSDDCATEEMMDMFNQEKVLQREIEGRGKELTSLIRQCESLEGATVAESKRLRRAAAHLERSWHNIWIRSLEKQCLTEQRLLQRQKDEDNHRESSDLELDEGPLNKHRRLTLDRWTAVASTPNMDKMRLDGSKRTTGIIKTGLLTKDIGVLCSDLVPVNDKGIMVGTTSIAALKAEYGDDFTNFEIIQDVGYSSESSTHLSSDDGISVGGDRYFNIRVYNYSDDKAPSKDISLKDKLKKVDPKQSSSLASSVGSSSGATSFNDSGLGAVDLLTAAEAISEKCLLGNDSDNFTDLCLPGEESDFLETVLESCVDFCASDGGKEEDANNLGGIDDLQYNLSGMESDDSADNFHNRSSFTTSSQLFYKMILVDSENDEETNGNENNSVHDKTLLNITNNSDLSSISPSDTTSDFNENFIKPTDKSLPENKSSSTDSEQETFKEPALNNGSDIGSKRSSFQKSKYLSSTPIQSHERNFTSPNLKRKRDSDSNDFVTIWEGGGGMRVRSWLKRCSKPFDTVPRTSRVRRSLFRSGSGYSSSEDSAKDILSVKQCEDLSSCDASGEYTSSSADEGNAMSSSSSFFDDDAVHLKERFGSCSGEGSIETVIRGFNSSFRSEVDSGDAPTLLPPPLSSTPSCLRRRQCTVGSLRCCNGPFSSDSCADLRWFVLKASSEGDLRTRSWHVPDVKHSLSNHQRHEENCQGSTFDLKHRLSSSLPNVLRHRSDSSAEDAKGSIISQHSDSNTYKHGSQHDESLTSFVSHNQSSSSDFERRRKRRSRRKSSSSNRSSRSVLTSSDKGRHRSATLTSRCSSRRRNFSQRSDFFEGSENFFSESDNSPAVVNKTSREELNLKDELELALEDNLKSCRTAASLLLPAESDVVLTHLEEQSTVSDQVWDGYQDMPYLSEAYSEATVDEDAVRKLTEFGDDYGSAIGQPLRFLDTQGTQLNAPKSPSKKSSKIPSHPNDSDSDLEGLHHVIEEAGKALQLTRATLKRRQSGDFFSSAENAELLATCGTYLHWLQTLCEQIAIEGKENSFSGSDLKELHYLVEEWKILKRSIEMFEELDGDEIKQKYLKAQQNIDALFSKMSELSSLANLRTKDLKSWEDLQENISRLQMVLSTLQDTREQLLAVNLQVHRFVTEYGNDASYKENCLKEDVTELYQKWDDIYERNGAQLTELEALNTAWKNYSEKFHALNSKLNEAEHLSSKDTCDIDYHSFKDEVTCNLLRDLKVLKADAEALRKRLRSTETWKSIQRDLRSLEKRVHTHTRSSPASRSAEHPNSSSVEDDPDDHFEDAIQQMEAYESFHKKSPTHHLDGACKSARTAKKKSSRFWRIIRVAVPVQLTLVLLFCLACYLEPNCCDRLNNFSFSFTPHLRYLRGPPPV